MKKLILSLLALLLSFSLSAQVVEDECPCSESWAGLVVQQELQQALLETTSALICEFPYSTEISENPISLLRPFTDPATPLEDSYAEYLYGLESLIQRGGEAGYLNESCLKGLKIVKAYIEKQAGTE